MNLKPTILAVFLAIAPCVLRAQTVTSFEGIDAAQVAQTMDDLGLGLAPQADADRFQVSFQSLSAKTDVAFAFMGKVLRDANIPEDELAKEKEKSKNPEDAKRMQLVSLFWAPS